MKKIIHFKKLFSMGTCALMFSFISAQENCWHWDYTDEANVVVTLNGSGDDEIRKLYDNIDNTTHTLSIGDIVEFEFPYAMCFTGMLVYSGDDETPVNAANFQIHGKKESGEWENNKGKTAVSAGDKGNGKMYTVANLTTAAGTAGYKKIRLECVNQPVTISEFQIFGFPNVASGNTAYPADLIRNDPGTAITGSATISGTGNALANATDGGRSTRCAFAGQAAWIECAFSEANTVKSYLIATTSMGSNDDNNRQMRNWTLQGSNTEGDEKEWETMDEVTGFIFPRSNYSDMKFSIAIPKSYKYYRLDASNGGQTETHISELQLYDTNIYVPENTPTDKKEIKLNDIAVKTAQNTLFVNSASDTDLFFTVYALTGNKIKSGRFTSSAEIFLQNGLYILKMINSKGMEYKTKIIIP